MSVVGWSEGPQRPEHGMASAEYAVGTIGACGVACVLIAMAPGFDEFLRVIIERAFSPVVGLLL